MKDNPLSFDDFYILTMPLLSDSLSVWEIAFRWTNRDPSSLWFRLPLDVRDHFRNMMDAILGAELACESISLEKRKFEPEEKIFSVYYWLDDIQGCIHGHRFKRKLLRYAFIERYDFQLWCERRNILLPEFWFPAGWNLEYELPEGEVRPGHYYIRKYWSQEQWDAWHAENEEAEEFCDKDGRSFENDSKQPSSERDDTSTNDKSWNSDAKIRPSQEVKIACRQIAKIIWKNEPDRTIASVVKDELLQKYGGASHFVDDTVRDWIKDIAPLHVRERRGRPKKGG